MTETTPSLKNEPHVEANATPALPAASGGNLTASLLSVLRSSGQGIFARMNNLLTVAVVGACIVVLWVVIIQSRELADVGKPYAPISTLLMMGAAAFGLGTFAGFVFGAVGEEKEIFGGIATAVNGVIGGFALSDLTKDGSVIIAVLHSLALSCGQETNGLVASVLGFYGAAGFMFMYMNKQYLLNPELSKKQQLAEQNQRLEK